MDTTGSWKEEGEKEDVAAPNKYEIGGNLTASLWMYTKAVISNGQSWMVADQARQLDARLGNLWTT